MSIDGDTFARGVYSKLANEDDSRLCEDIPQSACRATPRSFVLILASYLCSKLGDAVASPKTTLAWVCTAVGAPSFVVGFLVPLRESGSMLPQLFIGAFIRQLAIRKWVWVAGSVVQGLCVAAIGVVAFVLEGAAAGWAILALVAAFSLARGFCSIAAKDVLGKTIAKPSRGRLTGWSAGLAGLVSLGVGVVLMTPLGEGAGPQAVGLLLMGAGGLWLIAASLYANVPEYPGATEGGRSAFEALGRLRLLAKDRPFRRFILTRALMMSSALSAPFYVALAHGGAGSPARQLGAFVAAAGLASLVSAPVWGRFADRSSRAVMIAAAVIASTIGLLTFCLQRLLPEFSGGAWFLPLAYFVLSLAHSGVRVGRKTYVVNLGSGNLRTDYVAVGNSVIGLLLLLAGSVGLLVPLVGNDGVIALLALAGLAGAVLGLGLPEVESQSG